METLFKKLHPLVVRRDVEDILSWNDSKNDKFSVRSLYCSFSRGPRDPFPFSIVWKTWAPVKVNFFAYGRYGVICAKLRRKPEITCFFFVPKQECCGVWFSPILVWSGFCIPQLEGICWVDMTLSWVTNGRKCGGPLLCACGGLFGRKEIGGLSFNDVEQSDQAIKSAFL